ncbi:hypothetical protein L1049_024429 [Liquidambar formosana]|uniref:Uncharacterized protein n=1 Tax=Liquidambar formosana TaxID=63359 RepID=A0AAP0RUV3_LIQFO
MDKQEEKEAYDTTKNCSTMDSEDCKLHIVMYPWLAFGHMIPFLELAKTISQKGHRVSFISTPRNIDRLPKLPPNLVPLINFVKLPLPPVENLPENAEATNDIPSNKDPYLKVAFDGLQDPITRFLETSDPDWVVYDLAYWLCPIAAKLGVSCAFFSVFTASSISFGGLPTSSAVMDGGDGDPRREPEHFTVPPSWVPFPTNVAMRLYEAKKIFRLMGKNVSNVSGVSDMFRFKSAVTGCDVFSLRSCLEVEPEWLNLLGEIQSKPVFPVGLLPLTVQDSGDEKDETWRRISEWLNKHDKGSVVYVGLGSEVRPTQDEFTELALGLELSGLPFFWALRKPPHSDEYDPVELPGGFKDRTKGRGIVWTSWAPQLRILAHDSVGGFLTHCGWSSIIEALQFGRALIMLPLWGDQGLNARVFEEKEVGIGVPRDEEDGSFTRKSIAESLKLVMVDEEGKIYRDKAKEMKKIFGDKERQSQYIDDFVECLKKHRPNRKGTVRLPKLEGNFVLIRSIINAIFIFRSKIKSAGKSKAKLNPLINLDKLPLPRVDNLPENAEATIDVPSNKDPYLKVAFNGLHDPIAQFLQTSDPD